MRFFTKKYYQDLDFEQMKEVYKKYKNEISIGDYSSTIKDFVEKEVNWNGLHDAKIISVETVEKSLTLIIRCGDLEKGYYELTISYKLEKDLKSDLTQYIEKDILANEFGLNKSGKYTHIYLFEDQTELKIDFVNVEFESIGIPVGELD